jgi:hypothetical protein
MMTQSRKEEQMYTSKRMGAAVVLTAAFSAWPLLSIEAADGTKTAMKAPAASHVEADKNGGKQSRVILTQKAADRLGIKTAKVGADAGGALVAPYAAVLYDVKGQAWVYTQAEPLAYVRHPIVIQSIKGENALLTQGPPSGTAVVVIGAAELYGAESGVGH